MSNERCVRKGERPAPLEQKTVIIRTTDAVIRELVADGALERKSRETQRVVERVLRANNRGRKVVVSGDTRAIAAWIDEVRVACVELR